MEGAMRHAPRSLTVAGLIAVAIFCVRALAQEPAEKSIDRIIPAVVLKPGESQDVLLSSSCMRITRGRGLLVAEMGNTNTPYSKSWSGNGVTASIVYPLTTGEPESIIKSGLKLFKVRVSAANDAKPRLLQMHLRDQTCAGNCDTDFRIVVDVP